MADHLLNQMRNAVKLKCICTVICGEVQSLTKKGPVANAHFEPKCPVANALLRKLHI